MTSALNQIEATTSETVTKKPLDIIGQFVLSINRLAAPSNLLQGIKLNTPGEVVTPEQVKSAMKAGASSFEEILEQINYPGLTHPIVILSVSEGSLANARSQTSCEILRFATLRSE